MLVCIPQVGFTSMHRISHRRAFKAPAVQAVHGLGFLVAGLCSAALFAGCGASIVLNPSPSVPADKVSQVAGSPIDHIVIIMQENRTLDNLFNGFPGADTEQTGQSNGLTIPLKPVSLADGRDLEHSHMRWLKDMNNGAMDGFAQSHINKYSAGSKKFAKFSRQDVD